MSGGGNPSPDNIAGGLSSIEEKALGGIQKSGSRPIQDLLGYAEKPCSPGLYLMDAPCPGAINTTAEAASGCNLIIFTTGQGNPIGNPIAPTLKVTGNPKFAKKNMDNIDVDLSFVIEQNIPMEKAHDVLLDMLIRVASGRMTCAEILCQEVISVKSFERSL